MAIRSHPHSQDVQSHACFALRQLVATAPLKNTQENITSHVRNVFQSVICDDSLDEYS
eukprot:CAMPEP_0172485608 /NCGR_PEP_ID=MMETSP1066-20121228/13690_1 /TAXON_ID=671091 /ORGANISM="Coscinodiscus wailesii, Strain CCMP2513" /LENGTH=57 /DNA_ID=CAMNT_0013250955 /DNA_START=83 /DNA_END=253 /DNA_ORIENTATION=-